MRIDGNRGVDRPGSAAGKAARSASGFANMVAVPKAQGAAPGLPVNPLASILGIAEERPDEQRRRKAVRHAKDLLEDLEGLQRALSLGTLDQGLLHALANRLEGEPTPADPELADLIGQIEVRVAVELARYQAR